VGVVATGTQFGWPGFVFGEAAADVAVVDIALDNGELIAAPTVAAPSGLDAPLRFYAAEIPRGSAALTLVARDSADAEIERRPLRSCGRPFLYLRGDVCTWRGP
jgi:hypothetical protein